MNKYLISLTILSVILTGCAEENSKKPSDIKISQSDNNVSSENVSSENVSSENISSENISSENISSENISSENISSEKVNNNKEQKVNIENVFTLVKSLHDFKATEPDLYNQYIKDFKSENIKLSTYTSEAYKEMSGYVRVGYLYDSKMKKINNNEYIFEILTINAKVTAPSNIGKEKAAENGLDKIKNIPQPIGFAQVVRYHLKLNKNNTNGELTIDPRDKEWYNRTNN